jgi:HSP20 family protein
MYPVIRSNCSAIDGHDRHTAMKNFFDNFFEDDWGFSPILSAFFNDTHKTGIKTNVTTSDTDHRIDVVIPGLDKNDIVVDVGDTTLTISYEAKEDNASVVSYHSFERTWNLPHDTKASDISAKYDQGILSIVVPKVNTEATISHRVEVK